MSSPSLGLVRSFIVKCLEAYYPESLNVMLIHNPPWVFQGIWKLLGPMLDPVVRNKIEMTKSTDDLAVHIDRVRFCLDRREIPHLKLTIVGSDVGASCEAARRVKRLGVEVSADCAG